MLSIIDTEARFLLGGDFNAIFLRNENVTMFDMRFAHSRGASRARRDVRRQLRQVDIPLITACVTLVRVQSKLDPGDQSATSDHTSAIC